jgi:hypothetical protein
MPRPAALSTRRDNGYSSVMSDSAQEKVTEEHGVPPVPGHQGGPPPVGEAEEAGDQPGDDATSTQPHHVEPRAGRDQ